MHLTKRVMTAKDWKIRNEQVRWNRLAKINQRAASMKPRLVKPGHADDLPFWSKGK